MFSLGRERQYNQKKSSYTRRKLKKKKTWQKQMANHKSKWQPTPQAPSEIRWDGARKYDEAMVFIPKQTTSSWSKAGSLPPDANGVVL